MREHENGADAGGRCPFLREWPALTLKLILLHAAGLGADAMGWTRGAHERDAAVWAAMITLCSGADQRARL
jgi:hypothetical protein